MRTRGRPADAARRAALGGITAGLMIGLAACGTTVAGTGAAASGPMSHAPAAGAAGQSSMGRVNPGGVMVGPGASRDPALCRAVPTLTRMVLMLSGPPPNQHVREILPAGFAVKDPATVRHLAELLCALPVVPPGRMMCPNDMGASYRIFFFTGGRSFKEVSIELTGCRVVTGLGPARSWFHAAALGQALSQHLGIHFPLSPLP